MALAGSLLLVPLVAILLLVVVLVGLGGAVGAVAPIGVLRGAGLGGVGAGVLLGGAGATLLVFFETVFRSLVERGVLSAARPEHLGQGMSVIVWTGALLGAVGFVVAVPGAFLLGRRTEGA